MAATEGNHGSKGRGSQDEDENGFDLGWDLSSPTRTKKPLHFVCPFFTQEIRLYAPSLRKRKKKIIKI